MAAMCHRGANVVAVLHLLSVLDSRFLPIVQSDEPGSFIFISVLCYSSMMQSFSVLWILAGSLGPASKI